METVERTVPIPGLDRPLRVLHVTDTHLLLTDETESRARNEYAVSRTGFFRDADGSTQRERFLRLTELANRTDLLVMTGDIVDFPSMSNLAFFRETLTRLTVPFLYVPGNHDYTYYDNYEDPQIYGECRRLLGPFCGGDPDFQTLRIGGIAFVGLSNVREGYDPSCEERLASLLQTGERVVIAQHVPFACKTLKKDTEAFWGRDICLGPGATEGDGSVGRILRLLEQSPNASAILAGHLHFSHVDRTAGGLLQIVTAMSCTGPANLLIFSPA